MVFLGSLKSDMKEQLMFLFFIPELVLTFFLPCF